MAKLTRAQLEQNRDYHEREHMLYMIALQYVMRDQVTKVCVSRDKDGSRYEYHACGETRADGGLVLVTFKPDTGQEASTRVNYIENEYQNARDTAYTSEDRARHYECMSKVLMHATSVARAHEEAYLESRKLG